MFRGTFRLIQKGLLPGSKSETYREEGAYGAMEVAGYWLRSERAVACRLGPSCF
jgi:hypothetical protein